MFKKVTIIGVGLIGGSIGLAAKRKRLAGEVVGVCAHRSSLRKAKLKGAIDKGTLDYQEAVRGADLVILATPVNRIISIARVIAPWLKPGCLVTDVGSTKGEVTRHLERSLRGRCHFIGSHPMAGSEQRGVAQARADLFRGSLCFIACTKKSNPAALHKTKRFWQALGCRTEVLSPQEHDRIVAAVSHLPHLAAGQLVNVAKDYLSFAATGFLDSTRIAASDSEIWTDIFLTNKKAVLRAGERYIRNLKHILRLIRKDEQKSLRAECKKIKVIRDGLKR